MIRLVYTRRADADIRAVWRHVAAENESAADRILIALMDRIESLRRHPRLGPRRPDIRPAARVLVEGHHLVLRAPSRHRRRSGRLDRGGRHRGWSPRSRVLVLRPIVTSPPPATLPPPR
ncbi:MULTISPECIES: type II toxin-antitoxin system RelE/ParE family toxin [Rhodoplanes]|uniref:type II toxin-antitoxin system RelE/ParE family toxin n=1 Tax=Rhodoplanes TaxID=29407 RepID=UPI001FCE676D|nr:type II toxin-antitoxin system RelE/ParE family toxin [Rhodoplanes serenus]